ncbi:MAG: S8 family serine peptidase [Chloroherpetonaceae bacterium]|nr:S8 family serine peptidase [Chloroherpetonaceae bacterium]
MHHVLICLLLAATVFSSQSIAQAPVSPTRSKQRAVPAVPLSEVMPGIVVVKLRQPDKSRFSMHNPTGVQATSAKAAGALAVVQAAIAAHHLTRVEPLWKAEYENKLCQTLAPRLGTGELGEAILSARTPEEAAKRLTDDISRIYYLHYADGTHPALVAAELTKLPEVEYAEPSYIYSLSVVPNDSAYGTRGQDFFEYHNIPQAWQVSTGSPNVIIAILDTGVEFDHPDLQGKIWTNPGETGTDAQGRDRRSNGVDDDGNGFVDDWRGWDFWESGTTTATQDNNPYDEFSGHGTGTAGLAGANTNNGIGIASTGFNCRLMIVKLGGTQERVRNVAFIDRGIVYAATNGASIINSSFGGPNRSRAIEDAVNFATNAGALVVAAAGNGGTEAPSYPAAYLNALSVGAVFHSGVNIGQRTPFSNFGATVKVYAAGNALLTTVPPRAVNVKDGRNPTDLYILLSGTSFSCPIVAGIAGLIKARHPSWSPQRIATQIRATAFGPTSLRILDASAALRRTTPGLVAVDLRYNEPTSSISARIANYNAPTVNAEFLLSTSVQGVSISNPRQARGVINTNDTITLTFGVTLPSNIDFTTTTALFRLDMIDNPSNYSDVAFLDLSRPAWFEQARLARSGSFHGIKLVNRNVAWACADGGVVMRSLDGGRTWTQVNAPTPNDLYCINALNENVAIVGDGPESGNARLYRTADGGQSWQVVSTAGSFWNAIHFFDAQNGIAQSDPVSASSGFILVKTTDGGATWLPIAQTVPAASGEFGLVNSFQFVGNSGWFGTNQGRVLRTTNRGDSWSVSSAAGSNDWLVSVAFASTSNGVVGGYTLQNRQISSSILRRTTDGGQTWLPVFVPNVLAYFGGGAAPEVGQLWLSIAGSQGAGILTSRDGGATWVQHNSPPLTESIAAFSFLVTADSVFGLAISGDGVVLRYAQPARAASVVRELNAPRPETFALEQNYPNPFNPTTVISYQLPVASTVSLKVYDMLGREVATLFSGRQAAGRYQATFNASGLASGMYFYRLQAGSYVETKKMMLLK